MHMSRDIEVLYAVDQGREEYGACNMNAHALSQSAGVGGAEFGVGVGVR